MKGQKPIIMQQAQGGYQKKWCHATKGGKCSYTLQNNIKTCKRCHITEKQKLQDIKNQNNNKKIIYQKPQNPKFVMQKPQNPKFVMQKPQNDNFVMQKPQNPKFVMQKPQNDNFQIPMQKPQNLKFVMQEAEGGWRDSWCPMTKGGSCNYKIIDGITKCSRCKREKKNSEKVQKKKILNFPKKISVRTKNGNWCSMTMGGHCDFVNGICVRCKKMKNEENKILVQKPEGGFKKNWCPMTMGGKCNFKGIDGRYFCTRCKKEKKRSYQ